MNDVPCTGQVAECRNDRFPPVTSATSLSTIIGQRDALALVAQ